MVVSRFGIVATSQTLASAAGADILREGGSAVDAAIAANAALGVIEPMMNGIGGDLFAIVYDAREKKLYGINSSGWAPQQANDRFLEVEGHFEIDITEEYPFGNSAWSSCRLECTPSALREIATRTGTCSGDLLCSERRSNP